MQRGLKLQDNQLFMLAEKGRRDSSQVGFLFKKSSDSTKWQLRWLLLYQNLLFYFEAENSPKPAGVIFLEGSYCDKLMTAGQSRSRDMPEAQHCFAITFRQPGLKHYEFCAKSEPDCNIWVDAIQQGRFAILLDQKEQLEQKYLHLLQIIESEKTGKCQYAMQCEEMSTEINKMRAELSVLKRNSKSSTSYSGYRRFSEIKAEDSEEIKKIKKVQSFFRGWLCRRRWKQIVEEYIHSPHAENMRKRNSLVFRLVESEEEYLEQLELMVSCFLRPFKMAASSKKPPCTHDDVNSIFLNSETVMFLHQIFLKGLTARMENWPTLVLGDLFNMLLPMLCIYQEYVRNHHYSLQVLTECKQNPKFAALLKRLEEKPAFNGRSLESFLTYPMHQIPRYIITIHELLAHTPHNHVERKSLDEARIKLEELSRQMHDEVSETENIRKNLAIERMIVEGCDILLDVNQVFVRQGSLIQIPTEKPKGQWNRISSFKAEKEAVRQCFLFTNHMLLTTRSTGGRLHLVAGCGKISLADTILIEDPSESSAQDDDGESSSGSVSSQSSEGGAVCRHSHQNHDFKLVVDVKANAPLIVHLAAANMQEKAAWISDISHCMDNVHFNDLFHNANNDTSSVTMPQSIRNDPRLFKDDVDIRFSRTLNSCKVPQIRYATPKRLLDRLTDLRFLSIDFLNTFMLTYRVFTDGITVLEALKKVYYNPESRDYPEEGTLDVTYGQPPGDGGRLSVSSVMSWDSDCNFRRISSVSCNSETTYDREREHSLGHASHFSTGSYGSHWKYTHRKYEEEQWRIPKENSLAPPSSGIFHTNTTTTTITSAANNVTASTLFNVPTIPAVPSASAAMATLTSIPIPAATSTASTSSAGLCTLSRSLPEEGKHLQIPNALPSSQSSETLTEPAISAPSSPSSITTTSTSTHTLVPTAEDDTEIVAKQPVEPPPPLPPIPVLVPPMKVVHEPPPSPRQRSMMSTFLSSPLLGRRQKDSDGQQKADKKESKSTKDNIKDKVKEMFSTQPSASSSILRKTPTVVRISAPVNIDEPTAPAADSPSLDRHRKSTSSIASAPAFSLNGSHLYAKRASTASSKRGSCTVDTSEGGSFYTPRGSFLSSIDSPQHSSKAGVVVTSSRPSQRRSSTSSASAAFAVATAGCSNPRDQLSPPQRTARFLSAGNTDARFSPAKRDSMMSSAATMRVLRVLRHWVSKHSQDFENGPQLMQTTVEFLEEVVNNVNLLPAEHKAATQLFQMITREEPFSNKVDLDILLAQPTENAENIETLSALEIAEQMTLLDHKIFISIQSEEFLGQAWMKPDKASKTPNILLITKRFNDVSRLVVSEIIRRTNIASRITVIEKWAAVADICRCLHNYNGVLQICAAFVNSSVFRLKKTWDKVSKTTKQTVEKLQNLVSSDGRFRNLREALHRCDPPCIPYLGMYLTDLSFIEEGTPNFTDDGLLNFSKMRMIAHVIREIRHFQQTPYKIEMSQKVTNYLLDSTLLLPEDELYRMSLTIEPRQSRLSTTTLHGTNPG